jgi:hypothetical protein
MGLCSDEQAELESLYEEARQYAAVHCEGLSEKHCKLVATAFLEGAMHYNAARIQDLKDMRHWISEVERELEAAEATLAELKK